MALNFPSSPTTNQLFPAVIVPGVPQWRYDGNRWRLLGDSAPEDGQIYARRDGQWIQVPIPEPPPDVSVLPMGGRLVRVNVSTLRYEPFNGGWIRVNGTDHPIPASGITAQRTVAYLDGGIMGALAANTFYRVYVFWRDASNRFELEFSLVPHVTSSTSGNVGTEIKQGDDTRTLVGIVYTGTPFGFYNDERYRWIRSWLNRPHLTNLIYADNQVIWQYQTPVKTNVSVFLVSFANETLMLSAGGNWYTDDINPRPAAYGIFVDNVYIGWQYTMSTDQFRMNASCITTNLDLGIEGMHEICLGLHTDGMTLAGRSNLSGIY